MTTIVALGYLFNAIGWATQSAVFAFCVWQLFAGLRRQYERDMKRIDEDHKRRMREIDEDRERKIAAIVAESARSHAEIDERARRVHVMFNRARSNPVLQHAVDMAMERGGYDAVAALYADDTGSN